MGKKFKVGVKGANSIFKTDRGRLKERERGASALVIHLFCGGVCVGVLRVIGAKLLDLCLNIHLQQKCQ